MAVIVGTNSYISEAEADTYFEGRLYSDKWTASTTHDVALLHAASLLDSQISWTGQPLAEDQAMAWPRKLPIAQADVTYIPSCIREAQCELALYLLGADPTATPKTAGYKSLTVDTLKLEVNAKDRPAIIPAHVAAMLAPLGFPKGDRPTFQVTR